MTKSKHLKLNPLQKKLAISAASFASFILLVIVANLVYGQIYYDRVYPRSYFLGNNISGLSSSELRQLIAAKTATLNDGLNVCLLGDCLGIKPSASANISSSSVNIFTINNDELFDQAFNFGRRGDFGQNLWDNIFSLLRPRRLDLNPSLDQEALTELLKNYFDYSAKDFKNADLTVDKNNQLVILNEEDGWEPDYQQAIVALRRSLASGENSDINLQIKKNRPQILRADLLNLNEQADLLLAKFPVTWRYQEKKWSLSADEAKTLLGLGLNQASRPELIFAKDKIQKYLSEKINKDFAIPLVEPKFKITEGRVYIEEDPQDGLEINYETSILNFFTALAQGQKEIDLAVQKTTSQAKELAGLEQLEIVGIGTSTFAGSPTNRRVNIKTGASAINGVLIKPGEEFSLIKALGKIDGTTGYVQELVIKENKTTPEYGGGLCQIGTTLFRAVVNSGLPVTMRRNHSYRVAYYEPAGTDATIYDPLPDFRFMNDTGKALLLQTKISGDKAVFTFWGTRDGRTVSSTKPVIYNIVKPGPTKLVETTDLKPGEKKCTEKAHNGADAYFDYQVIYPSGEEKKVRFSSHYVPWREVCLVGVAATSTPMTAPVAEAEAVIN